MKPWEKYQGKSTGKPWEKYGDKQNVTRPEEKGTLESIQDSIKGFLLNNAGEAMDVVRDMPRAGSVATRNVLEGLGQTADFVGTPLRAGMVAMGMDDPAGGGERLADYLGLEKPATPTERVLSEAEKVIAGAGGLLKGAQLGTKAAGSIYQKIAEAMAYRPDLQLSGATGSGLAGGYAKEQGWGPYAQLAASLGGGIAGPVVTATAQKGLSGLTNAVRSMTDTPNPNVEMGVERAIRSTGVDPASVSQGIRAQLRKDMAGFKNLDDVSPDVLRRLAEYRLVGAEPTAGPLSLDPGLITRQKNLAKMGAASQDPKLQELSQIQNRNVGTFTRNLNAMGANTSDDALSAGSKVTGSLDDIVNQNKSRIDPMWQAARDQRGVSAKLNPRQFTQRANDLLDEKLLGGDLPDSVRTKLNSIAKGDTPFTVAVAEQFKKQINERIRSSKGPERVALGQIRQALEEVEPLDANELGPQALEAFRQARMASKEWMQRVEKTPALKAVMDGVEPDKFVQDYVIGNSKKASTDAVRNMVKELSDDPQGLGAIKSYLAKYLKEQGTRYQPDEMGTWSQSSYNNAVRRIGDEKLRLIFDPDEYTMIKTIGRVSGYEQAQPVGSAVNNSNSGTTVMSNMLDWVGNSQLLRRIPLGGALADNAKGISGNIQAGQMSNLPKAFKPQRPPARLGGVWPLAGAAAISPEEKRNNNR